MVPMFAMRRRSLNAASSVAPRSSSSGVSSARSSGTLQSWTMAFTAASTCTSKRPLSTRAADRRALASSKASWAARARARASFTALCRPVEESCAAVAASSRSRVQRRALATSSSNSASKGSMRRCDTCFFTRPSRASASLDATASKSRVRASTTRLVYVCRSESVAALSLASDSASPAPPPRRSPSRRRPPTAPTRPPPAAAPRAPRSPPRRARRARWERGSRPGRRHDP